MNAATTHPPAHAVRPRVVIAQDVITLLAQQGAADVRVIVGGIIPEADIPVLRAMGVHAVFTPGADLGSIVESIEQAAAEVARA